MAEIVYPVGSGETYASPQAAFDAIPLTHAADTDYVVEIRDSATYGVPGGNTYPIELDRAFAWASNSRILFRATTHHAEGVGGPLISGATAAHQIRLTSPGTGTPRFVFQGLRLQCASTSASSIFNVNIGTTSQYHLRFTECHLLRSGTSGGNIDLIKLDDPDGQEQLIVDNCTFVQGAGATLRSAIGAPAASGNHSNKSVTLYNNTFAGANTGVLTSVSTGSFTNCSFTSRNNVWLNTTTPVTLVTGWTSDRNYEAHTGTGTSGANSDNSIVAATYYNTSTWARVSAGLPNPIDDDGATLAAAYERDINGTVRTGLWSKGSREFVNNQPPTVDITLFEYDPGSGYVNGGAPFKALPTDTLRFTATASDPDGTIAQYSWDYRLGAGAWTPFGSNNPVATLGPLAADPTNYEVRCAVVDNNGALASDSDPLTIRSVLALGAGGGSYASMRPGLTVDASASRSANGVRNYSWSNIGGGGGTVISEITGKTGAVIGFAAPWVSSAGGTSAYRVTVSDGAGNSDTLDFAWTWFVNRQAALYMINAAVAHIWEPGIRSAANNVVGSTVLYWWAGERPIEGEDDYYGMEGGGRPTAAGAMFQGNGGTGVMLRALATAAHATGNKRLFRYVDQVVSTCMLVQEANGPWADMGVLSGVLKGCQHSGTERVEIAGIAPSPAVPLNDDGCYQSMIDGFVSASRAIYEWRPGGPHAGDTYFNHTFVSANWQRPMIGDATFGTHNGANHYFQRTADLRAGGGGSTYTHDFVPETIVDSGNSPFDNGGVPEVLDIRRAFQVNVAGNLFSAAPATPNPFGAYMACKTINDSCMGEYLMTGIRAWKHLVAIGHAFASTLRAELVKNVEWLVSVFDAGGKWGWGQCYGTGPTKFLTGPGGTVTYLPAKDEIRFARPQDAIGYAPNENTLGRALGIAYGEGLVDGGTTPTAATLLDRLQWYADRLARPGDTQSTPRDSFQMVQRNGAGAWRVLRYYPSIGDTVAPVAAQHASLGLPAGWDPTDRNLIVFGGDEGGNRSWQLGYDRIDRLTIAANGGMTTATTPAYTGSYNTGYVLNDTASDGQPYNDEWDAGTHYRVTVVNAGTGVVDTAVLDNLYNEWLGLNQSGGHFNMVPGLTAWDAWDASFRTWAAGGAGSEYYDTGVIARHLLGLAANLSSFANTPPIDDLDGDGVPDAQDQDPYDPDVGEANPPATAARRGTRLVISREIPAASARMNTVGGKDVRAGSKWTNIAD